MEARRLSYSECSAAPEVWSDGPGTSIWTVASSLFGEDTIPAGETGGHLFFFGFAPDQTRGSGGFEGMSSREASMLDGTIRESKFSFRNDSMARSLLGDSEDPELGELKNFIQDRGTGHPGGAMAQPLTPTP